MRFAKFLYAAVGIALLVYILQRSDLAQTWALLAEVGVSGMALVIGIYLLSFLGDSISWLLIVTSLPVTPTWVRRFTIVRLAGEAFNNLVPAGGFAGEPVKAVILKRRYGISVAESSASIVMARTVNMIALIVFLIIGFAFMLAADGLGPVIEVPASLGLAFLTIGTVLLFAVQRFRVSSLIMRRFQGRAWAARIAGAVAVIEDLDARFLSFYTDHQRRLTGALILAFLNWFLGAVEIYVTFVLLGHPVTWAEAWMIEALLQMVRAAVFFIPLGIGAQEGVLLLIVGLITGVPELGLACAAVRRVRELFWNGLGLLAGSLYPSRLKGEKPPP